ncbi:hypothetical protein Poli38472_006796 [Pythium oligandrum]|uniref:Sumo ligase n=1 Tax=Pythium oligandrum TaxID=41045 RepID=A0A8K1C5F5_PYTOL|nr:hypothetical protein Poli38472_006796 [Pythium oligandrum]|eukprot:TMW56786.1 hypothetical protein Poli38472_006796 [Pythium oligandrum]
MRRAGPSRVQNIRSQLHVLRVRELQLVLADLNLPRSGRKQDLIERIATALEQFEAKATENASNQATAAFYTDQLNNGLRSVNAQMQGSWSNGHNRAPVSTNVTPPPTTPSPTNAYAPYPPTARGVMRPHHPAAYGQLPSAANYRMPQHPPPHVAPPIPVGAMAAVEVLRPSTPDALQGARCFCGIGSTLSGKVVTCLHCGLRVHARCHQLVTATTDEWYCEACRAELFDPFLIVSKTILPATFVRFNKSQAPFRIEYVVSDKDLNELYSKREQKPGAMTPGCRELQLRCFAVKEELATGTSWPTTSQISVNGFNLQITQRAPPGQSNPSKVLRELPTNVFPFSRVGRNVIEIRTIENPTIFAFTVQIVEFRDVNELVEEVKAASANITYDEARENVIKSFGGGDDDDEDAIIATCTMLSVRCPLGLCVITLPARGLHCKHLQCFDLKTFLQFNKKARSRAYRCTVCHNFIRATDLRIDPYFKQVLAEVEGEEELEEVEISPDASWKRRVTEDAVQPPPQKKVKQEVVEADTTTSAAATSNGQSSNGNLNDVAPGTSAFAPVEIDLSLSSDEDEGEDDEAGAGTNSATAAPSGDNDLQPASQSSNGTLSDDEVAILTVDNDIWETAPQAGTTQILNGLGPNPGMMPFPLDETIYPTFPAGNTVDLASNVYPMYNLPSVPATTNPYVWDGNDSTSAPTAVSTTGGRNESEVALAGAMASLSQNNTSSRPAASKPPTLSSFDVIDLLSDDE